MNSSSVIAGTVNVSPSLGQTPVVVLAYSKRLNVRKVADYTLLHEPGSFEIIVPRGRYTIFAFGDKNRNLVYDAGEPAGQYPVTISAGERSQIQNLNVTLAMRGLAEVDFPRGAAAAAHNPKIVHSTLPGALADLDDAHFSYANGKKGYWRPLSFFREIGCNIYFLDAYDPSKIPVLFVHGATGSPLGWRLFFDHMDLNRFQPWFYYYPSGASLQSMADILYSKLLALQDRYCFGELVIVAHSMGGLIVRSVLVEHGRNLPFISKFISLSTPWAGDPLAVAGVKYSPAVIPAWKDLQPDGDFARSIFRKKLPPGIDYYLLFGYKNGHQSDWPNSDGVVALTSQLDLRSQLEAKMVVGFNEDHSSILTSNQVLAIFNRILHAAGRAPSKEP